MGEHEGAKPFPEDAGLSCDRIKFAGNAIGPYGCGCLGLEQLGLLEPGDEVVAIGEPLDHRINRSTN